ncbi:TonB-dependent receptor [Pseudoalteromonas nigrifaciens]|nr:TonB-dependent receptor [Pseudoalteromonas nigrifaciens]
MPIAEINIKNHRGSVMNLNDNRFASNLTIKPLAFAIACAVSGQAFAAQEPEQAEAKQTAVKGIERVSVTAQKRISTLQETPIAITAFNAEAIENLGIEDISDVNAQAPNVKIFPPYGSTFNVGMDIRGLGTSEPSLAIDPKVGIYLDGVYLARNSGAIFNIVDLERMEILRGPQGTLWGKNTTGGALNLVTRKPSDDFQFKQKVTVGNNSLLSSTTSIDTGAIGNFTARLTYMTSEHDGWATNTFAGAKEKNLGAEDVDALRVALRYTGDDFTVNYSYDNTDGSSVAMPVQISNVRPQYTDPNVPTMDLSTGKLYAGNVFAMMAANEKAPGRQTEFELDQHGREYVDIEGHNLTFEWDFSDNHTFKSISSFRSYDSDLSEGYDTDGGAYFAPALDFSTSPPSVDTSDVLAIPAFQYTSVKSQEQKSQEFQLLGQFLEGDLKYVAGYYYFSEEGEENNPWNIGIFTGQGANVLFTGSLPWGSFYKVNAKSSALFTNVDYKLTDELNVVAGIRYTKDTKSLTNVAKHDAMLRNDLHSETDWSKTVGSLLFNYVVDQDLTMYASISQGYAAGVYNPGSIDRFAYLNPANMGEANYEGTLTPADPEDTTAYEVGVKAMLLDDRLMLNTAVFLNNNTNLQKTIFDGSIRRSLNTGESKNKGIEIDAKFAATDSLFFTTSLGYLDTKYSDITFTDNTSYSASVAMNWTIAELDFGNLALNTNYVMVDDYQFSVSDPSLVGDNYALLNARLTLSNIKIGERSNLKVSLWGKNITDEEYIVFGSNFNFFDAQAYGTPRTYGIDVSFEY